MTKEAPRPGTAAAHAPEDRHLRRDIGIADDGPAEEESALDSPTLTNAAQQVGGIGFSGYGADDDPERQFDGNNPV